MTAVLAAEVELLKRAAQARSAANSCKTAKGRAAAHARYAAILGELRRLRAQRATPPAPLPPDRGEYWVPPGCPPGVYFPEDFR